MKDYLCKYVKNCGSWNKNQRRKFQFCCFTSSIFMIFFYNILADKNTLSHTDKINIRSGENHGDLIPRCL